MPPNDIIKFPEYAPDLTPIDTNMSANISNVVPKADGYGPFASLTVFTGALPSPCRGVFFARDVDQSIITFAGTSDGLYKLTTPDNKVFSWVSVGGSSSLDPNKNWQFAQYNTFVIAVHGNIVPQVYTLGVSSNFAALGGSPPKAGHVAVIGQFVVLSDIPTDPSLVKWSGFGNPAQWTPGTNQADEQQMQDGGYVRHVAGGDQYGVIFQDSCIRSMTFQAGSPVIFTILKITEEHGLNGEYSVIKSGDSLFYYSYQGFMRVRPGGAPVLIGKERVDRTFLADLDQDNMQLFIGASDPVGTRVYWTYKSLLGSAAQNDKIMCFDYALGDQGRWSLVIGQNNQFLTSFATLGLVGSVPPNSKLSLLQLRFYLAGFNSLNQMGTFSGPNLEAILETDSKDLGDRYAILFVRPLCDAQRAFVSIGAQATFATAVGYAQEQALNAQGLCPARTETRYARARLRIPAGTAWTVGLGVRPHDTVPNQGDR